MSLTKYNQKRDFNKTSEPKGKLKPSSKKRFVIQYHQARAKHYDFRLEHNGVLLSWAVPKGLSNDSKVKRLAVQVEDHPLDYIDYEGIIPKGNYGAGKVEIFDKGEFEALEDFDKGVKKGHIKIVLNGDKCKGGWSLIRTDEKNWLIIKIDDQFASSKPKKTKLPFKECDVQLATLSSIIPKGKDWAFEIKYDGYRIVSFVENGKVKMLTRNKLDYTKKFDDIAQSLAKIDKNSFVVDGEVVAFDENGRSDFGLLQESIKNGGGNLFYVIFDLLAENGEDLRSYPLFKRKEKLDSMLFKSEDNLIYSAHVDKGGESFKFAKKNNLEGIIAKKLSAPYTGKRGEEWLKIKCYKRQEFVLAGYTTSEKNQLISAILLGYFKGEQLIFVGKVGTGLDEKQKRELSQNFKSLTTKDCPFNKPIKVKNVIWLKPKLVAEIQFAEVTKEGLLRQPSFIALRQDKKAKDVTLEEADGN